MCPEAYLDSLRRLARAVQPEVEGLILDAGCGSGLLLPLLADCLSMRRRYLGLDILSAGLHSVKQKAEKLNLQEMVAGVQASISRPLPLQDASVACVAAHFSVYTLPEERDRRRIYQEFWRILKPGGLLVTANPTDAYEARRIIQASLEQLQEEGRPWVMHKYLIYPWTLHLGLKYIQRQLKSGYWHGYRPGELQAEVEQAGFSVDHSETVYGGSGCLVAARKS